MTGQKPSFLNRMSQWFGIRRGDSSLPLETSAIRKDRKDAHAGRLAFLRPWAKRDAAIASLQESFKSLDGLLGSIQVNLERQNHRQQDLSSYLAQLPEAIRSMPESQRLQCDTLITIRQEILQQNAQQSRLADILKKVSDSQEGQKESLDILEDRMQALKEHDQRIVDNLKFVSAAMQSISRTSESSSQILQQLHESINAHDGEMERILRGQSNRMMVMMAISLLVALVSLGGTVWLGVQFLEGR